MAEEGESSKGVQYEVVRPQRHAVASAAAVGLEAADREERRFEASAPAPPSAAGSRFAVLAIHGMGQQVPFETLDSVRAGLARLDENAHAATRAKAVQLGDESLDRLELDIADEDGKAREVHLYEAYWAPLTEGKVTLRDTIGFLARGAWNGVRNARRPRHFCRWLFGGMAELKIPFRTFFQLVLAFLGVLSLVLMNGALAFVFAGRLIASASTGGAGSTAAGLGGWWTTDALFLDLTGIADLLATGLLAFALVILVPFLGKGWLLRRRFAWKVPGWLGGLTTGFFFVALYSVVLALIAAAAGMVELFLYAHRAVTGAAAFHLIGQCDAMEDPYHWVLLKRASWIGLGALVLLLALSWLATRLPKKPSPWLSAAGLPTLLIGVPATLLTGWIAASLVTLLRYVANGKPYVCAWGFLGSWQYEDASSWRPYVSWAILAALTLVARRFFVQYVGDVAAYVTPQTLDRFWALRGEIKAKVLATAAAIYDAKDVDGRPLYDGVIAFGHSLGSVLAYDTLNALIERDLLAGVPAGAGVATRTRLLLTFGSPLDKLAFLFARQTDFTKDAREALAAGRQPLILDYAYRPFPWVNVYSRKDILGGPVLFFDSATATEEQKVRNEIDPEVLSPVAGHTEYWANHLVFAELKAALEKR